MNHVLFFCYLFITSSVFALLEIQIEGKNGWAAELPTWRLAKQLKGWMRVFIDPKKPITGYHVYLWTFLFLLSHLPFLLIKWNIQLELLVLSYYWLLLTLEDFLWFIYNPHYGIKKFNPKNITWHTVWLFGLPLQYWVKIPIGVVLYLYGTGILF